jgi:hypothetical protein
MSTMLRADGKTVPAPDWLDPAKLQQAISVRMPPMTRVEAEELEFDHFDAYIMPRNETDLVIQFTRAPTDVSLFEDVIEAALLDVFKTINGVEMDKRMARDGIYGLMFRGVRGRALYSEQQYSNTFLVLLNAMLQELASC